MSKSVVVFGMAHSGKSTLVGYLFAQNKQINVDKLEEIFRKKYGSDYDNKQIYAYIVNNYRDEVKKLNNNSGSTKANHYKKISIDEKNIVIIDTPGVEHKNNERKKGMFYSDIGVFCIELSQIIEENFLSHTRIDYIISQLMLWTHFKKEVIVLLTKSDMTDYREEDFLKARENISNICDMVDLEVKIVPISINVATRNSHNVLSLSNTKMPWYSGESFYDILSQSLTNVEETESKDLMFYIDRQYKTSRSYSGKSWRIKILSGVLKKEDRIILSPVKIGNNMMSLSCKIKTIRYDINRDEDMEFIESASVGDVVGIDVDEIKVNTKTITKEDFDAVYTTCGFSCNNEYKIAKYVVVEVSKDHSRLFKARTSMSIVWFGRSVGVKVFSVMDKHETIEVVFETLTRALSLPFINNKLFLDTIIIDTCTQKFKDSLTKAQNTFIDAKLIELREEL